VQRLVPAGYVKPIWARDKSIDSRQDFGHWELDLVVGKKVSGHDSILTLVERKTRKLFAKKVRNKNPRVINKAIKDLANENNLYIKTITCDNGFEFEQIHYWHIG
ncbi:IS30 family transposase, partial [Mesomycoplasma ovipneumoniae]